MQTRHPVVAHGAFIALLCLLLCPAAALAQVPQNCPLPAPTGYVNDYAGVVDAASKERMEAVLANLKDRAQIEFSVAVVRTTGERPIFDYSLDVARCWGIGSKEGDRAGMLLLVAVDDRKYQPQVSRHLEGDLPDGLVTTILLRTLPDPFRAGEYGRGLTEAVLTLVATLADKRGFSIEGIDQRYIYRPRAERRPAGRGVSSRGGFGIGACCLIGFILIILLSSISRRGGGGGRGRGGWGGGGGGGLLNAIILGQVLSNLGGGGRSSGWGGGGSSGWGGGGGGGGGFGGFGGGGDFGGGGGPGGSW
jgi:uncharacterized protein